MTMTSRRDDFPIFRSHPELHYLDSAATSQKPSVVLDALREYYECDNANPHRGAYALSVRATDRYHDSRARIAKFVGLPDPDCLIFTRGTTESLNLVATAWGHKNIISGDEIVVTGLEHHANFVPWQQVAHARGALFRVCPLTDDQRVDMDALASMMNRRTKVVAFSHVSNAVGTVNDVPAIVAIAQSVGALTVCDGAQAVPHMRVNFAELGVDFYAFSGHKMCGPMGSGVLLGKRRILEGMPPYQFGGDMIEFVREDRSTWNVLPHKFEAGTPNVGDAVGLAAACEYLDAIGMDDVLAHERVLVRLASQRLQSMEGIRIYGPGAEDRSGVVSFTVEGIHPHDLATILDQNGVCVRAGHHCAQPLMRRLNVAATARASFYLYNDEGDVDALITSIEHARSLFAQPS